MNDGQDMDGSLVEDSGEPSEAEMLALLERLREEHRRIDQEIGALLETGVADMLKVRRMKKIKLSMKDQIAYLENQVTPDIIA
ncbi:MAG: DUF465 domain-containing protein [Litorimonas sp.]